jgi:hypothetical protein
MVHRHPSTPTQRAQWVGHMIAHGGEYGQVTALSRASGVSRQTLYAWCARGLAALERAFVAAAPPVATPAVERAILTLLVEGHASYRGIQGCLRHLMRQGVSLGTIAGVVGEAQRRALAWMAAHAPPTARAIALDEIYGNDRRGAYLSVVDTAGGAVWAAEGPVPVDQESWTLVLWLAQARGLRWHATVHDGGKAIQAACASVEPPGQHGRDVWHVLHTCAQVQGRLDRQVAAALARAAAVARYAARRAAGERPRGRKPTTDEATQAAALTRATRTAHDVRYLTGELHRLLEVVVLEQRGVLDSATRRAEVAAALALLAEVREAAPPAQRAEVARLHTHLAQALPGLLAFAAPLDQVQRDMAVVLGAAGLALVAWAWQRRAVLGPTAEDLLAGLPPSWRPAARVLFAAWAGAVRASSAAETWHSVLRPHLAVHRTLSPGLLAVLAVWHNHRVYPRGVHHGRSPLQVSGGPDAPSDWLAALGYPAGAPGVALALLPTADRPEEQAA